MSEKPTTNNEGKRIHKDMKVNGKQGNRNIRLNHEDSVTSILISLTV